MVARALLRLTELRERAAVGVQRRPSEGADDGQEVGKWSQHANRKKIPVESVVESGTAQTSVRTSVLCCPSSEF